MFLASLSGTFYPAIKIFAQQAYIPLLWATAFLTLSELIAIRQSLENQKNDSHIFDQLTNHSINQILDNENISFYLSETTLPLLKEVSSRTNKQISVYLPVGTHIPDKKELKKYQKITLFISQKPSDTSFVVMNNSESNKTVCLLGYCDDMPVFAKLNPSESYTTQLISNASELDKNNIRVTNLTRPIIEYIADKTDTQRHNAIRNEKLELTNTYFFTVASEISKLAEKSICAIDFIPPITWTADPVMKKFIDAQKQSQGKKQRVHVFNSALIYSNKDSLTHYQDYVELMHNADIEVKFFDLSLFDTHKYEPRGSIIIDDTIVAIAINPGTGVPFGEICYSSQIISSYRERFDDIWNSSIKPNEFFSLIKTATSPKTE